jgi:hypothetical protein
MNLNITVGLLGLALLAQADPPGTTEMSLFVGQSKTVTAPPAARVFCDDPAVVQGIRDETGARFTGLKVGSTLCGDRRRSTMIAAPVQCDVDGIPKGSHYARTVRSDNQQ